MKKLILTLLLLVPVFTGCCNIDANIDFIDKKNVFFSANLKTDDKTTGKEIKIIKENMKDFIDDDFITDVLFTRNKAKIEAVKLSKNIKRSDINLSSLGFKTNNKSGRFIDVKHNLFVNLYSVDLVYNLDEQTDKIKNKIIKENKEPAALKPEYLQKYGDESISLDNPEQEEELDFQENFENTSISKRETTKNENSNKPKEDEEEFNMSDANVEFSVTLPSKASYNNADRTVDNTYYWKIQQGQPTEIKLQYIVYNSFAITILLLSILAILYLLARRILKYDTQKRIGSDN